MDQVTRRYIQVEIGKDLLAMGRIGERVELINRPDQILIDLLPHLLDSSLFVFIDVPVLAKLLFPDP